MLEGHHFQNAYVTRDIEKWVAKFQKEAKIDLLLRYEGTRPVITANGPTNMSVKLAFIWVGDMQYEIIQPVGDNVAIYSDALPSDDGLKFHHTCMRLEEWDDFRARVDQQPYPVVLEGGDDEGRFIYLDMRAFVGHYVEFSWMTAARWEGLGFRPPTQFPAT